MKTLAGKIALVTGSSGGLGKEIALALAREGARVAIHFYRDQKAADETLAQLRPIQSDAIAVPADIRNWSHAEKLIDAVGAHFGRLDILVNNAGSFLRKPLSRTTVEEWADQIESNLYGTFYCCRAALPRMREQGYGRIINIALANADRVHAYKEVAAHGIAKTGVLILTRSLALEEAAYGITVNAISPGLMDNGRLPARAIEEQSAAVPMKRLGTWKDVSGAILYLVSDQARYITGANIVVSGGWGV